MTTKIVWVFFAALCLLMGIYPVIYFLIDREFGLLATKSDELLINPAWNAFFYAHIITGGIALFTGWSQFVSRWRNRYTRVHRNIGKLYVSMVLFSALSALYIAFFSTGGLIPALGFTGMGLTWLLTTIAAFYFIRRGNVKIHQVLMVYSYATCFSAVTLRIWLPILIGMTDDFMVAYKIVAWLSWLPNILVAWLITRKMGTVQTMPLVEAPLQEVRLEKV